MSLTDWTTLHGDHFRGTTALVTGGAGFIGSHLTQALLTLGADVTVLDDLSGGSTDNFAAFPEDSRKRLRFVESSLLDRDALADAMRGCSLVFHQAALGSVPRSVTMPRRYAEVNIEGTLNVLEAARQSGTRRVVFAASSSAYGDTEVLPKVESMPVLPRSPYAATKVAGEALMRSYAISYAGEETSRFAEPQRRREGDPGGTSGDTSGGTSGGGGLDAVSLRYFNIFGPRQNANSAYAAVIAAFAKALLAGKHPLIFGDGEQSRDFTHVDNAVHANLLAARAAGRLGGAVCNIACGQRVSVNELAAHMAEALDRPELSPTHEPARAGDVKHSLADLSEAAKLLGYQPIVDFARGLRETMRWYEAAGV